MDEELFKKKLNDVDFIKNYEFEIIDYRLYPEYLHKKEYLYKFIEHNKLDFLEGLDKEEVDLEMTKYIITYNPKFDQYIKYLFDTYDKLFYYAKNCNLFYGPFGFSYYLELSYYNKELKPIDNELLKWYMRNHGIEPYQIQKLNLDYDMAVLFCNYAYNIFNIYKEQHPDYSNEEIKSLLGYYINSKINKVQKFHKSDFIFQDKELVAYLMENNVKDAFDYYQDYCVKKNIRVDEEFIKFAIDNKYTNISNEFITPNIVDYIIDKHICGTITDKSLITYIINNKLHTLTDKQLLKLRYDHDNQFIYDRLDKLYEDLEQANKGEALSSRLLEISDDLFILNIMFGNIRVFNNNLYSRYEYIKLFLEYNIFLGYKSINMLLYDFSIACRIGKVEDKVLDIELFSMALDRGYKINEDSHIDIITNRDFVYLDLEKNKNIKVFDKYLELGGKLDIDLVKLALKHISQFNNSLYIDIFNNREYILETININPQIIDTYYYRTGELDDELINLALSNGYKITNNSPDIIKSNPEYIKKGIEEIILSIEHGDKKKSIENILLVYQTYIKKNKLLPLEVGRQLSKEIYDYAISEEVSFNNYILFDSYELCEYILSNCQHKVNVISYYEYYLETYKVQAKKPDFDLYIKQIFNGMTDLNFCKLSPKENKICVLLSLYLKAQDKRAITNVKQLPYYVTKDGFTDNFYKLLNDDVYKAMLGTLRHNMDSFTIVPDFIFEFFIPYFEQKYSKEKIEYLKNELGKNILFINIDAYLGLDIDTLKKIVNLFKIEPFGFSEFNDKIYDSLKQEQFKKQYPIFAQIYGSFSASIDTNNQEEINRFKYLIKTLLVDYTKDDKFIYNAEVEVEKTIDSVIDDYKNGNIEPLHILCNKITKICREIYRDESNDICRDLNLKYDYNDFIKKATLYIRKEIDFYTLVETKLTADELTILKKIIVRDKSLKEEDYRKYGPRLNDFYREVDEYIIRKKGSKFPDEVNKVYEIKREKSLPPVSYDILDTLVKFEIKDLVNIVNDEEVYNNLLYHLHYYKIPMIPDINDFVHDKLDIKGDIKFNNIWNFIIFYKDFLLKQLANINSGTEENISISDLKFSFSDLFNYIVSINSEILEYRLLLGSEDYKLIVTDPGRFPSSLSETKKIMEVIKYIPKLYNTGITIPSFDKNIIYNNKEINVIVGNRTSMCNLTHGERTDACMRCGSIGDSLYDFCLTSPNGFHIRFEEPNTHEYISRVSGFRNGNTVFLNQLRYSCNKDLYSSLELIEYLKIIAHELIDLSKDSKCPIENVCISNGYAMSLSKLPSTTLKVGNIQKGIGDFYSDVTGSNSIILASSNTGIINLDNTNVEINKPVRDKVYGIEVGLDKLTDKINIVSANKSYLINNSIYHIKEITDIVDGYVGTDFYVYIDDDYDIHYDYFDMVDYHDKEVSLSEMNKYKEVLRSKYNIVIKRY